MHSLYPWQTELWRKLGPRGISLGHALLLRGRKGLGKLAFGSYLAKSRLCEGPSVKGEPCEVCSSCHWFEQGSHPDFRLVEPEAISAKPRLPGLSDDNAGGMLADTAPGDGIESATEGAATEPGGLKSRKKTGKQISVGQIRNLADFINISTHRNGYRVLLIHPAEAMNLSAANALLKSLEEPPTRTLFILVTHQPQHLLATIRSRCHQIAMPAPGATAAITWLRQQGVKNPEMCLASAGYAPLAALEFDDAGYLEQHRIFIRQISAPVNLSPIALAEEMQNSDLPTVVNWLQKWCYDLMSFRTTGKIRYHLDMPDAVESVALNIDPPSLACYIRTLIDTKQLANHPLNARLFLEEMLFSYAMALFPERSARIG